MFVSLYCGRFFAAHYCSSFDSSHNMSTFSIHMLHVSPLSSYLFSISAPSASEIIISPHLARPLPVRHTIFGITPLCQDVSQWHHLSPLSFQHPLLSAAQSWCIYPPSHWSFSQTTRAKGGRGCRDVSQPNNQPASLPAKHSSFPSVSCKAHLLEAALDAISNSIPSLNFPESF